MSETLNKFRRISNFAEMKTWAEKIRVFTGSPVYFAVWAAPAGFYAQIHFSQGRLTGTYLAERPTFSMEDTVFSTALTDVKLDIPFPGTGTLEGFYTQNTGNFILDFVAVRLLGPAGTPLYPALKNRDILLAAGYHTATVTTPGFPGPTDLINTCLRWEGERFTYPVDGALCAVAALDLSHELNADPALPPPYIYYQFSEKSAQDKVERVEKVQEHKPLKVAFYGRLPKPHKEYKRLGEGTVEFGDPRDTDLDCIVVFDPSETPARFPEVGDGIHEGPRLINPAQYLKIIDHDEEENDY